MRTYSNIYNKEQNIVITAFVAVCLLLLTGGCQRKTDYSAYRKPVGVTILVTDSLPSTVMNTYVGKVEESTSLALRFPLGGKVTSVNVKKNQQVRQGQILATTDNTQQQNALATTRATLSQAQDAYNRLKKVYDEGALAEVKWVEIQTQLQKAKSAVSAAEEQLKDCIIRAPQDGIIEECDLKVGQQLLPSQTAIRLINTDGVEVSFPVPEKEISDLHIGDEAEIIVPALSDLQLTGRVSGKNMLSNTLTHSYDAKIALRNKDGMLMPGMMCKVHIKGMGKTGYVIPANCVHTRLDGIAVWLIKDGKATRRAITSKEFVEGGILVDSGLEKGDSIITSGYQKLYEGAEIKVTNEE